MKCAYDIYRWLPARRASHNGCGFLQPFSSCFSLFWFGAWSSTRARSCLEHLSRYCVYHLGHFLFSWSLLGRVCLLSPENRMFKDGQCVLVPPNSKICAAIEYIFLRWFLEGWPFDPIYLFIVVTRWDEVKRGVLALLHTLSHTYGKPGILRLLKATRPHFGSCSSNGDASISSSAARIIC